MLIWAFAVLILPIFKLRIMMTAKAWNSKMFAQLSSRVVSFRMLRVSKDPH